MILLITQLFCFTISAEIENLTTKTFEIKNYLDNRHDVVQGSHYVIRKFDNAEFSINIELKGYNEYEWDVCFAKQGSIQFGNYENYHTIIYNSTHNPDKEHANDPSYYLSTPIMVNMVQTKQGMAIVTSDHNLLIYRINQDSEKTVGFSTELRTNLSFGNLRSQATEMQIPQIIYAPLIEFIYIIYTDQVIGGKIQDFVELKNISIPGLENDNNFIGQVKVFDRFIFVPSGKMGLDIYEHDKLGNLFFIQTMNSQDLFLQQKALNVVDITFGHGDEGKSYLYVLDQISGVIRFILIISPDKIILNRDDKLGLIPIRGGFAISEHNDEYILILKELGITQQLVEIAFKDDDWFQVKLHYLTGQYFDIAITDDFILLRGKDEHRILRVGIYEEFEKEFVFYTNDDYFTEWANSYYEEYVFIPKLQNVLFYNEAFGIGNDSNQWTFNRTYPFLLGLTTHTLVELPYIIQSPYIVCEPKSKQDIGRLYTYVIDMNATACLEKDQYLKENPETPAQLLQCHYQDSFTINVVVASETIYNTQELLGIIIGLVILLILLAFLLAFLFRRFKIKEEQLTQPVTGFDENKKSYDMEPNDGPSNQGL